MDEATYERIADARVQRRLAIDAAYRNAENAEEQAIREDEITEQVCRELDAEIEERRVGE